MTLQFKLDDTLKRIIDHTTQHNDTRKTDPDTVYLVKDHGTYIMACTEPPLRGADGMSNLVAYADGCGPDDRHIGGNGFAENLPVQWFRNAFEIGTPHIVITLTDKEIKATT